MKKISCSLFLASLALADPSCRFAPSFESADIAKNQTARQIFKTKVLEKEAKFL